MKTRHKIILGVVVGLTVGVMANPLMPPAFFILGGFVIYGASKLGR